MQIIKIPLLDGGSSDYVIPQYSLTKLYSDIDINFLPDILDSETINKHNVDTVTSSNDEFQSLDCQSLSLWVKPFNSNNLSINLIYENNVVITITHNNITIMKSNGSFSQQFSYSLISGWNHIFISKYRINETLYVPRVYINGINKSSIGNLTNFITQIGGEFRESKILSFNISNTNNLLYNLELYTDNFIPTEREVKYALFTPSLYYKFNRPVENFINNCENDNYEINTALLNNLGITYEEETLGSRFENKPIKRLEINTRGNINLRNLKNTNNQIISSSFSERTKANQTPICSLFNGKKELKLEAEILYGRHLTDPDKVSVYIYGKIKNYYKKTDGTDVPYVRLMLYNYKQNIVLKKDFSTNISKVTNFDSNDYIFQCKVDDFNLDNLDNLLLFVYDYESTDLLDVLNVEFSDYNKFDVDLKKNVSGILTINGIEWGDISAIGYSFVNRIKDVSSEINVYSKSASYYQYQETNAQEGASVNLSQNYPINKGSRSIPILFDSELFRVRFLNYNNVQMFTGWYRPRHMMRVKCYSHALPLIKMNTDTENLTYTSGILLRNIGYSASADFHYSGGQKFNSKEITMKDYLYSKNTEDMINTNIIPLIDGLTVDVDITAVDTELSRNVRYMQFFDEGAELTGVVPYGDYKLRSLSILVKQTEITVKFFDENHLELGEYYLFNNSWKLIGNVVYPSTTNHMYTENQHISVNDKLGLLTDESIFSVDMCSPILINKHTELPSTSLVSDNDTDISDLSTYGNTGIWNGSVTPRYETDGDGSYHWKTDEPVYLMNTKPLNFDILKGMIKLWIKPLSDLSNDQVFLEGSMDGYSVRFIIKDFSLYIKLYINGAEVHSVHFNAPNGAELFKRDVWNLFIFEKGKVWVNNLCSNNLISGTVGALIQNLGLMSDLKIGLPVVSDAEVSYKISDVVLTQAHQSLDLNISDIEFLMQEKGEFRLDTHGHLNVFSMNEETNTIGITPHGGIIAHSFEEKSRTGNTLNEDVKIKVDKSIVSTEIIER